LLRAVMPFPMRLVLASLAFHYSSVVANWLRRNGV
jgi:hypothetical protein